MEHITCMEQSMTMLHIRKTSMDQHALSKFPQRLPSPFCNPPDAFGGAKETATLVPAQNCSNFWDVNSVPASL
jgi:hypothetical protein